MKHKTERPRKTLYIFRGGILLAGILFITILAGCPNAGLTPEGPSYAQVAFGELNAWLQEKPVGGPYYIEVTGLTAADLKGSDSSASPLGDIFKSNPIKFVALKLPANVEGLTNMTGCFDTCTSLVSVQAIPAGVTHMLQCFKDCDNLVSVQAIPASANNMRACFINCSSLTGVTLKCNYVAPKFDHAFSGCTALEDGGIKVPSDQLTTYQAHAADMGTTQVKFAAIP